MNTHPPKKYTVIALPKHNDRLPEPVQLGETLYTCTKPDYGSAATDSSIEKEEYISLTRDNNGGYPFITIPVKCVVRVS